MIEFPSLKAAQDCYHSPEYAAARAIRQKFADAEMVLVEGIPRLKLLMSKQIFGC